MLWAILPVYTDGLLVVPEFLRLHSLHGIHSPHPNINRWTAQSRERASVLAALLEGLSELPIGRLGVE